MKFVNSTTISTEDYYSMIVGDGLTSQAHAALSMLFELKDYVGGSELESQLFEMKFDNDASDVESEFIGIRVDELGQLQLWIRKVQSQEFFVPVPSTELLLDMDDELPAKIYPSLEIVAKEVLGIESHKLRCHVRRMKARA